MNRIPQVEVGQRHWCLSPSSFLRQTGFLCVVPTVLNSLCWPGWPWTPRYSPASASQVLRLKLYAVTSVSFHWALRLTSLMCVPDSLIDTGSCKSVDRRSLNTCAELNWGASKAMEPRSGSAIFRLESKWIVYSFQLIGEVAYPDKRLVSLLLSRVLVQFKVVTWPSLTLRKLWLADVWGLP